MAAKQTISATNGIKQAKPPTFTVTNDLAKAAMEAGQSASVFVGRLACAWVYIQPVYELNAQSIDALKANGFRIRPRSASAHPVIYIGYDNLVGDMYGKAKAIAAVLSAGGLACYEDADED